MLLNSFTYSKGSLMSTYNQIHSSSAVKNSSENTLENISKKLYSDFKECSLFYARFHIAFLSFLSVQLFSFLLFFSYFSKLTISAFALALFCLTVFSYFVLIFFFQAKKPQQLLTLRKDFLNSCQQLYRSKNESDTIHLKLSEAANIASDFLTQQEEVFYSFGSLFSAIAPLIEKLRIRLHWKNFHAIKELLLLLSIEELVSMIKQTPTDLEAHASLAQAYSKLSLIYVHPSKTKEYSLFWIPPEYGSNQMQNKFISCSDRAIEELKILQEYGAGAPWIHAKLAEIYHLQERPKEEIHEHEELIKLAPDDQEVLFRLGVLYFKQGHNGKGLKIYEKLQETLSDKTESLIEYYDSYPFHDISCLSSL